jgi:hypothetical protein
LKVPVAHSGQSTDNRAIIPAMKTCLFLLGLMLAAPLTLRAEDTQIASLKGLKGINVEVTVDGDADLKRVEQQIKTDVELRMRRNGIVILTESQRVRSPGGPWLAVRVSAMRLTSGRGERETGFAYFIEVSVRQSALLDMNLAKIEVSTWFWGYIGSGPVQDKETLVRTHIGDGIDVFCNDYLSVNPK